MQIGVDLEGPSGPRPRTPDDPAIVFDHEPGHVGLHPDLESGQLLRLADEEVEELPLRHDGDEWHSARAGGVKSPSWTASPPKTPRTARSSLVRAPQEGVEQAELVDDAQGRRMHRVAAEVAQEVGMLLEHDVVTPARASRKPSIIPAGPPPTMQQRVVVTAVALLIVALRAPTRPRYPRSGACARSAATKAACASRSTGRWRTTVLAGYLPRKLPPFRSRAGRTGRGTKPPPQFGQVPSSTPSAQRAQKVHSKLQIRASAESGGSDRLQCSQVGRSSSMMKA